MASYEWLNLNNDNSYDQLVGLLDSDFNPRNIADILIEQVSSATEGMLIEYGYVDKDYRSTFYNFYAKKGRRYRADCVRLHFFDKAVSYDKARTDIVSPDGCPQDHYFGYIVLRPTLKATLGRTVLSPNIRSGASGLAIQSIHKVNLLGHQLTVWGFPSMAQHGDIAVCAHVACWSILRYYSETFAQQREYLIHEITKLTAPFDPGGLVPSLGISKFDVQRVFQATGYFPMLVVKKNSTSEEAFLSQLFAYIESGFPLFAAMPDEQHAIVLIGYHWRQSATHLGQTSLHVWHQVQSLLAVDDNLLPYSSVELDTPTIDEYPTYSVKSISSFIVALPEKIHYPADAIDEFSHIVEEQLVAIRPPNAEPFHFRRYFIMTIAKLREHARQNRSSLGDTLVGLLMRLESAQHVWVVEYCSEMQWNLGHISARAIVDATASLRDSIPVLLLHNEDIAFVFDRSSAKSEITPIELNRTTEGPLPRIEINLRSVAENKII